MVTLAHVLSNSLRSNRSTPASSVQSPFPSCKDWKAKFSGSTAPPAQKTYTGDQMLGIATMHKSNAVPVFSNESAKDISKMK